MVLPFCFYQQMCEMPCTSGGEAGRMSFAGSLFVQEIWIFFSLLGISGTENGWV